MKSYEKVIREARKSVGTKQTLKMVELGKAAEVYVAQDADPRIKQRILDLCKKTGVKITYVDSMDWLGKACGIEVGAAMAATLNE